MRAVVVYESMYGNTHLIADAIGAGLETAFDVRVVAVSQAATEVIADADLVVVGGPTHAHGMSRATTRRAAVQAADKPVGGLTVEPVLLGHQEALRLCDHVEAVFAQQPGDPLGRSAGHRGRCVESGIEGRRLDRVTAERPEPLAEPGS